MKIQYGILGLLCVALSCTQQPANPGNNSGSKVNAALSFAFSQQPPTPAGNPADNWCRVSFPEAAVISADPANSNRRLFTLSDGPNKVMVDFGNIVAAFILKKSGHFVEIFTSDNFPECLSRKTSFSLAADGNSFRYDNQKHIQFEVQLIPLPNGTQIALEMAPGAGYGMIVRR